MTPDKIVALLSGASAILFIVWFFLLKQDKEVTIAESVEIEVKGGYTPATISIPKGKVTKLTFLRTDENSCLEEVVIADYKIRKYLPLGQKVSIELKPLEAGVHDISCAMNMFHGKIVVK